MSVSHILDVVFHLPPSILEQSSAHMLTCNLQNFSYIKDSFPLGRKESLRIWSGPVQRVLSGQFQSVKISAIMILLICCHAKYLTTIQAHLQWRLPPFKKTDVTSTKKHFQNTYEIMFVWKTSLCFKSSSPAQIYLIFINVLSLTTLF